MEYLKSSNKNISAKMQPKNYTGALLTILATKIRVYPLKHCVYYQQKYTTALFNNRVTSLSFIQFTPICRSLMTSTKLSFVAL